MTLAPMLNLVPFPALMNDRYLYIPLLGLLVPLLMMAKRVLERIGARTTVGPVLVSFPEAFLLLGEALVGLLCECCSEAKKANDPDKRILAGCLDVEI